VNNWEQRVAAAAGEDRMVAAVGDDLAAPAEDYMADAAEGRGSRILA
jgi:hypothetical protein